MRFRPSPAIVVAGLALFVALGGSAFGVSQAVKPQARCSTGAVRGIAAVNGEPGKGVANVSDQFSGAKALFGRAFNCAGPSPQVRRLGVGSYEVRFPNNAAQSALVSASGAESWLQPMPGGIFRVGLHVPGRDDMTDVPFVVVAV
jgi:hypothetical protein